MYIYNTLKQTVTLCLAISSLTMNKSAPPDCTTGFKRINHTKLELYVCFSRG